MTQLQNQVVSLEAEEEALESPLSDAVAGGGFPCGMGSRGGRLGAADYTMAERDDQ